MADERLTKEEMLEQVNNAISAILLTGQTYSIGSRSLTRANITELRHLKSELEAEVAAEKSAGTLLDNTYVGFFNGR
jgi:hypothetical protein